MGRVFIIEKWGGVMSGLEKVIGIEERGEGGQG